MELKDALKDLNVDSTRLTNVFTKNMFGRLKTATKSADFTTNVCMELETGFLALRIGIPNASDAEQAGIKVSVATTAQNHSANYLNSLNPTTGAATWVNLTFDGAATATLAARHGLERWSTTWSDQLFIQDIPRNDGSGRPFIMIRIEYPSGTVASIPFSGTYFWRTGAANRNMRAAIQSVAGVTDKAAFTSTTAVDEGAVIPLVQYVGKRQGHQVMVSGDSIQMGLGGQVRDLGVMQRLSLKHSTPEAPIEYFNAAIHSQTSEVYSRQAATYLPVVQPTIFSYSVYTINDVAVGGLTADNIKQQFGCLARVLDAANRLSTKPRVLVAEGLPCNTAYKNLGAGDAKRVEMNTLIKTWSGIRVMSGYADAISGAANTDGQIQVLAGMVGDNVHPNDAGYDKLVTVTEPYFLNLIK